jgi:hypothetical protein
MRKVTYEQFEGLIPVDATIEDTANKTGSVTVRKFSLNGKVIGFIKQGVSSGTTYVIC